ncbi:MAG: HlyD family efflux transporter periplasmic adaptor subunit [Holosporales bacterium]|nr:HlyD family efflux transporter periplasmic adaptor subunit [Holosporales bacterium]
MSTKAKRILFVILVFGGGFFVAHKYLNHDQAFMFAGTLDTTRVILSSKVAADIVYLPVEEGRPVKKGDLVAKLNDESFRIASRQIDAEFQRGLGLSKGKALSQSEFDKIRRSKEENDLCIRNCEVKAPIDGIVISKFRENGEYLNPGSNIISISDPKNIWAYFYVPYDMIHRLKIGDRVSGFLQEAPGKTFEGTIVKINETAEFTPKNVQTREERTRLIFGIKVCFENTSLELKPGMTMETAFAQ